MPAVPVEDIIRGLKGNAEQAFHTMDRMRTLFRVELQDALDVLNGLVQHSPTCVDLLKQLERADFEDSIKAHAYALDLLCRVMDGQFTASGRTESTKTFVSAKLMEHLKVIYRLLSTENNFYLKTCLRCLTLMTVCTPNLLILDFNFAFTPFQRLCMRRKRVSANAVKLGKHEPAKDIRSSYILLAKTLLASSDPAVVIHTLSVSKYIQPIFKLFKEDHPPYVLDFLTVLQNVIENRQIPRSKKKSLFNGPGVRNIATLLEHGNEELANKALECLEKYLTNPYFFRMYPKEINALYDFCSHLRPLRKRQQTLIQSILGAHPHVYTPFLVKLSVSLCPRLSLQWLYNVRFVCSLINVERSEADDRQAVAEMGNNVIDLCMPPKALNKPSLTQGLFHPEPLVKQATLYLLECILIRARRLSVLFEDDTKRAQFHRNLLAHFPDLFALLPLIPALQKEVDKKEDNTDDMMTVPLISTRKKKNKEELSKEEEEEEEDDIENEISEGKEKTNLVVRDALEDEEGIRDGREQKDEEENVARAEARDIVNILDDPLIQWANCTRAYVEVLPLSLRDCKFDWTKVLLKEDKDLGSERSLALLRVVEAAFKCDGRFLGTNMTKPMQLYFSYLLRAAIIHGVEGATDALARFLSTFAIFDHTGVELQIWLHQLTRLASESFARGRNDNNDVAASEKKDVDVITFFAHVIVHMTNQPGYYISLSHDIFQAHPEERPSLCFLAAVHQHSLGYPKNVNASALLNGVASQLGLLLPRTVPGMVRIAKHFPWREETKSRKRGLRNVLKQLPSIDEDILSSSTSSSSSTHPAPCSAPKRLKKCGAHELVRFIHLLRREEACEIEDLTRAAGAFLDSVTTENDTRGCSNILEGDEKKPENGVSPSPRSTSPFAAYALPCPQWICANIACAVEAICDVISSADLSYKRKRAMAGIIPDEWMNILRSGRATNSDPGSDGSAGKCTTGHNVGYYIAPMETLSRIVAHPLWADIESAKSSARSYRACAFQILCSVLEAYPEKRGYDRLIECLKVTPDEMLALRIVRLSVRKFGGVSALVALIPTIEEPLHVIRALVAEKAGLNDLIALFSSEAMQSSNTSHSIPLMTVVLGNKSPARWVYRLRHLLTPDMFQFKNADCGSDARLFAAVARLSKSFRKDALRLDDEHVVLRRALMAPLLTPKESDLVEPVNCDSIAEHFLRHLLKHQPQLGECKKLVAHHAPASLCIAEVQGVNDQRRALNNALSIASSSSEEEKERMLLTWVPRFHGDLLQNTEDYPELAHMMSAKKMSPKIALFLLQTTTKASCSSKRGEMCYPVLARVEESGSELTAEVLEVAAHVWPSVCIKDSTSVPWRDHLLDLVKKDYGASMSPSDEARKRILIAQAKYEAAEARANAHANAHTGGDSSSSSLLVEKHWPWPLFLGLSQFEWHLDGVRLNNTLETYFSLGESNHHDTTYDGSLFYDLAYLLPFFYAKLHLAWSKDALPVKLVCQGGILQTLFYGLGSRSEELREWAYRGLAIVSCAVKQAMEVDENSARMGFREAPQIGLLLDSLRNAITVAPVVRQGRVLRSDEKERDIKNYHGGCSAGDDYKGCCGAMGCCGVSKDKDDEKGMEGSDEESTNDTTLGKPEKEGESPYTHIAPLNCAFLASAIGVLLRPEHSLYLHVGRFLVSRPHIDLNDVPMFYQLFYSERAEDRKWIIKVLRRGGPNWSIFARRHVVQSLLSFAGSTVSDFGAWADVIRFLSSLRPGANPTFGSGRLEDFGAPEWIIGETRKPYGNAKLETIALEKLIVFLHSMIPDEDDRSANRAQGGRSCDAVALSGAALSIAESAKRLQSIPLMKRLFPSILLVATKVTTPTDFGARILDCIRSVAPVDTWEDTFSLNAEGVLSLCHICVPPNAPILQELLCLQQVPENPVPMNKIVSALQALLRATEAARGEKIILDVDMISFFLTIPMTEEGEMWKIHYLCALLLLDEKSTPVPDEFLDLPHPLDLDNIDDDDDDVDMISDEAARVKKTRLAFKFLRLALRSR